MKNEFVLAFNEVLEEKQLPKEVILKALESAMVSAYRRAVNASNAQHVEAQIDPDTGRVVIFAEKEVVEHVEEETTEVSLEEAKRTHPDSEVGMMVIVDSTPPQFGRVAAQTARQVIQQRIRDAERQAQLDFYQKQIGEIVSGVIQAVNSQGLTIGLEMRAEGLIPRKDLIPGERFKIHDRVRALVAEAKESPRGPQIILSRTHRDFLRRLLENEVPEIYHGVVEIRSIAREPGERAKVAVSATQSGIDPVGACVGIRGVRIQAIVRELHDEKIDVIEWSDDPTVFIAKAISPARVTGVYLTNTKSGDGKTATVVVPEDQLSLAIGRDGQNARLAAKLTGWRIDIKSLSEAASDVLNKLNSDAEFKEMHESTAENIPQIDGMLLKKAEGRPLTPEEYDSMARFVDSIERKAVDDLKSEISAEEEEHIKKYRASIPSDIFNQDILDSNLPEHVNYILQEAGIATVGELAIQISFTPDEVLKLQGIGPKAMTEINRLMEEIEAKRSPTPAEEEIFATEETPEQSTIEVSDSAIDETIVEEAESSQEEELEESELPIVPTADQTDEILQDSSSDSIDETKESEEEEEEEQSFDKLFALSSDNIIPDEIDEDDDDRDSGRSSSQKKKKKKHVEIEYDPDSDTTVVRKKRKRDDSLWDW